MKNKIFAIVLWLNYLNLNAQMQQFNRLYSTDTTSELTPCILPAANNTYIVGGISRVGNLSNAVYVRKLGQLGEIIWETTIDNSDTAQVSAYYGNCLVNTLDKNYAIASTVEYALHTQRDIRLTKFKDNGSILWQKRYHANDTLYAGVTLYPTSDKGYLIGGFASGSSDNLQSFLLLKTDSLGNLQWRKIYHDDYGVLFHAEQTTDGGYLVSGYNYHAATGYDMYAIKTDSLGNVQWEHTYGTDEDDCACRVMEVAPKQYALLGCIDKTEEFQPFWYTATQLMFARLDSSGNLINNSKRYYFSQQHNGCSAAYFDKGKQEIVATTYSVAPNPTQPYLTKFSLSGDMLLNAPLSTGIGTEDYLRDVEPTPNGGFVLAGFNFTNPSRGWVVKTDSLGNTCGEADCDNYVEPIGIEEVLDSEDNYFRLSPNPTNSTVQVQLQQMPTNAYIQLYNIQGSLLHSTPIVQQTIDINTSNYPTGIYYCKLIDNGNTIATQKLIIIR